MHVSYILVSKIFLTFVLTILFIFGLYPVPVSANHGEEAEVTHGLADTKQLVQMETLITLLTRVFELLSDKMETSDVHMNEESHYHDSGEQEGMIPSPVHLLKVNGPSSLAGDYIKISNFGSPNAALFTFKADFSEAMKDSDVDELKISFTCSENIVELSHTADIGNYCKKDYVFSRSDSVHFSYSIHVWLRRSDLLNAQVDILLEGLNKAGELIFTGADKYVTGSG